MGYYYGFWDYTYILVLIGVVICLIASAHVNSTFRKYSKIRSKTGMTGRDTALQIQRYCDLTGLTVRQVSGNLTDHYDPRDKSVSLSDPVYGSDSVAAIAVAAHECGHAVQDAHGYAPLRIRGSLVPVVNFGSTISWPLIIFGLFIHSSTGYFLIQLGILCFSLAVLFQLVTLPVEFNASHRALNIIRDYGIVDEEELKMSRKVLTAAALTYVASAASSILQLLRLLLLFGGRRDD